MKPLILAAAAALSLGVAQASPVSIQLTTDSGSTQTRLFATGGSFSYAANNDTVRWPSSGDDQSELKLDDFSSARTGAFGANIKLGEMEFENETTSGRPSQIDLQLVFDVLLPNDSLSSQTHTFNGALTASGNSLTLSWSAPFTYNWSNAGMNYLLTIWIDPQTDTVPRDDDEEFEIFAKVTQTQGQVPVPATLALLGLGCLGLAAARRRNA